MVATKGDDKVGLKLIVIILCYLVVEFAHNVFALHLGDIAEGVDDAVMRLMAMLHLR